MSSDDDIRKTFKERLKEFIKRSQQGKMKGSLIIPRSNCCGAPLRTTTGGIIMQCCSCCGKIHVERRY